MHPLVLATVMLLAASSSGMAEDVNVTIRSLTEMGTESSMGDLGLVVLSDAGGDVRMTTDLAGLPPGGHGFHIHAEGSCAPGPDPQGGTIAGGAAGDHWDPENTGEHLGPDGTGHLGDAPLLEVAPDGTAKASLRLPRVDSLAELHGKALVIHAGGDNYADEPKPLGGGGARIARGVIP